MKTLLVPLEYPNIQTAIAYAAPGDIVRVAAGIYREILYIDKSLTLKGEGSRYTHIIGPKSNHRLPTIMITSPKAVEVVICDLALSDERKFELHDWRVCEHLEIPQIICIGGLAKVTLKGLYCKIPVLVRDMASLTIDHASLRCGDEGVLALRDSAKATVRKTIASFWRWEALWVGGSAQLLMTDSIVWCYTGEEGDIYISTCVLLKQRAQATFKATKLCWAGAGLDLHESAQAEMRDSIISRNMCGIEVRDSSRLTMIGCEISHNESGIDLFDDAHAEIMRTKILENTYGLSVRSGHVTITSSVLADNRYGILAGADAHVEGGENEFINNGTDVEGRVAASLMRQCQTK